MNTIRNAFFVILCITVSGFILEIINPHSFLGFSGALIQGFAFLVASLAWYHFVSGKGSGFFVPGLFMLLLSAALYVYAGAYYFCEHIRITKWNQIDIQNDSCKNIIITELFNK